MHCERVDLGDGVTGYLCGGRRRRVRCKVPSCGRWAERQCDFPLAGKKRSKTCDQDLCLTCATKVGPEHDYCPAHVARVKQLARALPAGAALCSKCAIAARVACMPDRTTEARACSCCTQPTVGKKS